MGLCGTVCKTKTAEKQSVLPRFKKGVLKIKIIIERV